MGFLLSFPTNNMAKGGHLPLRCGNNKVRSLGLVEALQRKNIKSIGVAMRKRLKKKLDKQAVHDYVDWWAPRYLDSVNDYISKMSEFRERWAKRISLAQAKQA